MITGPNNIKDGLVLFLDAGNIKSYVSGSTVCYDLTKNLYVGNLNNGPSFDPSNLGCISFDGTNDFIEFGDILDLGTNDLTVNQWVNLNTHTTQFFFSKALASGQNYRFGGGMNGNKLYIFMQGNGGSDITPYGSTIPTLNEWFMVTYVYDRSDSLKIFYNGVEESLTNNTIISQWDGLNFQSLNPFRIGSYTASNNIDVFLPMNGKISMTQVYHRKLSNTEIIQNYNATKSRFGL